MNPNLTDMKKKAKQVQHEELVKLVQNTINLIEKQEKKNSLGKIVKIKPIGEAIIIGDIHGDLESLLYILEESRFFHKIHEKNDVFLIFLGDYGDRGEYSVEVYYIVLWLKTYFPENVILIRGNHEGPEDLLAYPHDLPLELQLKFGRNANFVYTALKNLFNYLSTAVIVEKQYLILHGGIPSKANTIDDLAYAHSKHPQETHLEEILWSDPVENIRGTYASPRGAGKLFGEDVTDNLLRMLNVRAIIRGHEPASEGFKINHHGKILTLFSRKGAPYYNEHAAYLSLELSLRTQTIAELIKYIRQF